MAIEIQCPGCQRTLRVSDEHAGKQLRCPACQTVTQAELPEPATQTLELASWHMRTPDGQVFGPVPWSEVQRWIGEGRIAADCQLANSLGGPWRPAPDLIPALRTLTPKPPSPSPPTLHPWAPPDRTAEVDWSAAVGTAPLSAASRGFVKPHRGGLILVLGILGIGINCPIFCFLAWVMGSSDLNEMKAGRMDRSGEPLTRVGQLIGMILSLLWILGGAVIAVVLLVAAIAAN